MDFRFVQRASASLMIVLVAACGSDLAMPAVDDQASTDFFAAKGGNKGVAPAQVALAVAVQTCATITFNDLAHADIINTIPVPLGGGFDLSVAVTPSGTPGVSDNVAKAYDAATLHADGDQDLQNSPAGPPGPCDDCDGRMMVIPNVDFAGMGDSNQGGIITLTGWTLPGETTIKSFASVDQDNAGDPVAEEGMILRIDGVQTGESIGAGNAEVGIIAATEVPIVAQASFELFGSGAIDDIEICNTPPPPPPTNPGTGTIGFWKQHPDAWPVEMITVGGVPYTKAQAIALMQTAGRGDKSYDLFSQQVAAKLNVLIGNEPSCVQDAIDMADAFFGMNPPGSNVRANSTEWQTVGGPAHSTLTLYNEGKLCAPKR